MTQAGTNIENRMQLFMSPVLAGSSHVSGSMRTWSQFSHRPHVSLFQWCQAVEAHAKEAGIEFVS